jgi:hypothetical protein
MRGSFLAAAAALLLLTGCHELWRSSNGSGGSSSSSGTATATFDPTAADQKAQDAFARQSQPSRRGARITARTRA